MAQAGTLISNADVWPRSDGKGLTLALLMTFVVGGALPIFSYLYRPSTWGIWGLTLLLIILFSRELPLRHLMQPAVPYLLWLICFVSWGLIVAPVADLQNGVKTVITTIIVILAMAIITSHSQYLKYFANALQWAMFFNLMLIPLASISSKANNIIATITLNAGAFESGVSRFSGFWGNPNMAGYVCLVAIILSTWSTPWVAWIGRLSAVSMIYLTASRKSMLLLLLIIALNVIIVQRHNLKSLFFMLVLAVSGLSLFVLSTGLLQKTQSRMASNRTLTRLLDVTESETAQAGGETRLKLLQHWLPIVSSAPWYGYGSGAMAGSADETGKIVRKRLFPTGTHNTYLGILVEVGPVGLITFLLVLLYYAKNYLTYRGSIRVRWSLLSFLACNIIILIVSHSHLFSFEGKTAFALFFLLPTSPALWKQAFGS